MHRFRKSLVPALLLGAVLAAAMPAAAQERFPTPEAAAAAIVEAARQPGTAALDRIFGPQAKDLLISGDEATDRKRLEDFLALAGKRSTVTDGIDGRKVLVFGTDGWRFPVPLAKQGDAWVFDLAAGKQEIADRAVGRNEVAAISACADYVAAQREYFNSLHDDQPVQQYAQRFISAPGLHDGLYWEPRAPGDRSPLGDRIAAAARESVGEAGEPRAYHGYIYRILTRQGADAPGGAYDYMVNGRLLAGFAMLAYPERWQETGVMTFLCDQRGQVYEINLGPRTAMHAKRIKSFDPGPGWEPVGE